MTEQPYIVFRCNKCGFGLKYEETTCPSCGALLEPKVIKVVEVHDEEKGWKNAYELQ